METNIRKYNYRTGEHLYQEGAIWEEHDGPQFAGGPYMNYKGKQVSVPKALQRIRYLGGLRSWKTTPEKARENMMFHVDKLTEAYCNGFDKSGELTEYALDSQTWDKEKYAIANEVCNLARETAGLPPLNSIDE